MDINSLIHLVVVLVILGLLVWLAWWFIGFVGIPEPFNKVARVIVGLVAFLIVAGILLQLLGVQGVSVLPLRR